MIYIDESIIILGYIGIMILSFMVGYYWNKSTDNNVKEKK